MVFNGEEHEAMRILLKQRLSSLEFLERRSGFGGLVSSRLFGNWLLERRVDIGRLRDILLAGRREVKLLDRRVVHLKVLEGGSSLHEGVMLVLLTMATRLLFEGEARDITYLLGRSDLRSHCGRV